MYLEIHIKLQIHIIFLIAVKPKKRHWSHFLSVLNLSVVDSGAQSATEFRIKRNGKSVFAKEKIFF